MEPEMLEEITEAFLSGTVSLKSLSKTYNVSKATLRNTLVRRIGEQRYLEIQATRTNSNKVTVSIDELFAQFVDGATIRELADRYKCHYQTIFGRLVRHPRWFDLDISRLRLRASARPYTEEDILKLYDQYRNGATFESLGYETGLSSTALRKWFRDRYPDYRDTAIDHLRKTHHGSNTQVVETVVRTGTIDNKRSKLGNTVVRIRK